MSSFGTCRILINLEPRVLQLRGQRWVAGENSRDTELLPQKSCASWFLCTCLGEKGKSSKSSWSQLLPGVIQPLYDQERQYFWLSIKIFTRKLRVVWRLLVGVFRVLSMFFPFRGKWNPVRYVISFHHVRTGSFFLLAWLGVLPGTFDFMAGNVDRAIISVVSPLNALMRDQTSKLNERGLTSFMVQGRSVQVEDSCGGEYQASFSMEALKEPHCRILFIHPEVCVDDSSFSSLLKSPIYQKKVKCVVVDEAHLIKEWFNCGLTYIKKLTKWVIVIINTCFD